MADIKPIIVESCTLATDFNKQIVTDGFKVCRQNLVNLGKMYSVPSDQKSSKAVVLGNVLTQVILNVLENYNFQSDDEMFMDHEHVENDNREMSSPNSCSPHYEMNEITIKEETIYENSESSDIETNSESEEYKPKTNDNGRNELIPLSVKIKVLRMAREHPNWSLKTLQSSGSRHLKTKSDLKKWQKDVEQGGTKAQKFEAINKSTYERFQEAQANKEPVTISLLRQWATTAALQYESDSFKFSASQSWIDRFKSKYKIRSKNFMLYKIDKNSTSDTPE